MLLPLFVLAFVFCFTIYFYKLSKPKQIDNILDEVMEMEIESDNRVVLSDSQYEDYIENNMFYSSGVETVFKPRKPKKPCKNCTCGKANSGIVDIEDIALSACGNCGKGDDYRCDSCPHLGKPPF